MGAVLGYILVALYTHTYALLPFCFEIGVFSPAAHAFFSSVVFSATAGQKKTTHHVVCLLLIVLLYASFTEPQHANKPQVRANTRHLCIHTCGARNMYLGMYMFAPHFFLTPRPLGSCLSIHHNMPIYLYRIIQFSAPAARRLSSRGLRLRETRQYTREHGC